MKNHETTLKNHGNQPKTMNKQKRDPGGVTTDLLDVGFLCNGGSKYNFDHI